MTVSTGRMLVLEWPSVYIGRFGIFRVPMLHPTLNILVQGKIQKTTHRFLIWEGIDMKDILIMFRKGEGE